MLMDEQKNNMAVNEEEEMEIDLGLLVRTMWRSFLKLWWLVLLLIAAGAGGFLFFQRVRYTPMYACSATFTVATEDGGSGSYSFYYDQNTADQLSRTFPYILDSSFFRSTLLERLGTDSLNGTITSETIEDSNVVTMRVESPSAEDSRAILDAALEIYPETAQFVLGDIQFNYLNEPETPTAPFNQISTARSLAMGGAGGAVIALVILGLSALMRRTARSPEEMKKITSLRCLALVPHVRSKARKTQKLRSLSVTDSRVPYGYKESIRALQVRVEKAMRRTEGKVLLITSTASGEGKSTLAVNLAQMFASRGSRILFIDGDLRKQGDGKLLKLKKSSGLDELVRGDVPGGELIRKLKGKTLWFLGGTRQIRQPASILSSPRIDKFLEEMRQKMDYIIIDTSPFGMFQDAGILADKADAILYVVKYDMVPQREILTSVSSLSDRKAAFLGYVFNEYPESVSEYGYGKYGYGKYGYGKYGYGKYGYGSYSYGGGYSENSDKNLREGMESD